MRAYLTALALTTFATIQVWPYVAKASEKGDALFTLYFVDEVKFVEQGGKTGKVQSTDGQWFKYRVSHADHRRAHMQGTASVKAADGKRVVASFIRVGVWKDLPPGWDGRGNRRNPLFPYRSAAADQKVYPYGTRIYLPQVDGYRTPDGFVLDGYFWVSDVGTRIKGPLRFDLFVGHEPVYEEIKKFDDTKWHGPVVIDRLPKLPEEWDPQTPDGLARVLSRSVCQGDASFARLNKDIKSVRRLGDFSKACLVKFQQQHRQIPEPEHGMAFGAITLWNLTQAASVLHKGQKYVVEKSRKGPSIKGPAKGD